MEDSGHPFLDTSQAKNKIWLLSVPKYLGELWKAPECRNQIVGQLSLGQITKPNGAKDMKVTYILDEKLSNSPPDAKKAKLDSKLQKPAARSGKGIVSGLKVSSYTEPTVGGRTPIQSKRGAGPAGLTPLGKGSASDNKLPREHEFTFHGASDQKLIIISKTKHLEHTEVRKIEGQVAKRAQLKPPRNKIYDQFKSKRIQITNTPKMVVQKVTLREARTAQKHKDQQVMENERNQTGSATRTAPRMEEGKLMEVVLDLFQKHEYYHINDLIKITLQPQKALREVLDQIGQQNKNPDHKHKWELKDDYKY